MGFAINGQVLNASRIARIQNARSLGEAQQMGLFDWVRDRLRGGVKRAAIEDAFNKLQSVRQNDSSADAHGGLLVHFAILRDAMKPEFAPGCVLEISVSEAQQSWSYRMQVDGKTLAEGTGLPIGEGQTLTAFQDFQLSSEVGALIRRELSSVDPQKAVNELQEAFGHINQTHNLQSHTSTSGAFGLYGQTPIAILEKARKIVEVLYRDYPALSVAERLKFEFTPACGLSLAGVAVLSLAGRELIRIPIAVNDINSTQIASQMSSGKSSATTIGFWNTVLDMLQPHKKADALKELHTLIQNQTGESKFDAFNKLKTYAGDAFQDQFKRAIDDAGNIIFSVGDHQIATCDLRDEIFVARDVKIPPMSHEDKELFLFMLDRARVHDKEIGGDLVARRENRYADTNSAIYKRYRPGERFDGASTALKPTALNQILGEKGEEILKHLNAGTYQPGTLFNRIGYRTDESGKVKFERMHPLHIFMRGVYVNTYGLDKAAVNKEDMCERSTFMLNIDVKEYTQYNSTSNKLVTDELLGKIYEEHGCTLRIVDQATNIGRNALM